MILEKFLSHTDFASYEDFHKNYKVHVPENFNFAYDVVDELAAKSPDKVALVWRDDKGGKAQFTFGEMKYYSDKAANFFKAAGIKKGDPVMLILKRHYEFWFCILALHKIGAVGIPATHLLTTKDIIYRCNAASVKMIVSVNEPQVLESIDGALADSPTLMVRAVVRGGIREGWVSFDEEMKKAGEKWEKPTGAEMTQNSDKLLLYFTSGTTGYPKMVQHNFVYPLGHILTAKYWQHVRDGGLHLTVADTGWAKAAWGKIYGQWICECAVYVYDYDKFVPKEMLQRLADDGVTSFCAPPTIYRYFIKEDLTQFDFKLEHCSVAGEPLNPEIFSQFLKMTGHKLIEGYGQTELTITLGTYPGVEPRPGSMGKPSPGYDIDIIDENGNSCEVGEVGQIIVRTDKRQPVGMFDGYYRDDERTQSVWHDGIYYTGDTAWRDEDGYYWFVGRTDDVIKSSGYRIGPFEVESALLEHPAVMECAVTGVPDEMRGAVVKATVVLTKNYTASEELKIELQEHVKKVTAPYKYPRIIEFVTELPKTISGKIRRVEIREKDKTE